MTTAAGDEAQRVRAVAWVCVRGGLLLGVRTHGKDAFYFPGGKPEAGEGDRDALCREVAEELCVRLVPDSLALLDTYTAPAHGYPDGSMVQLSCYTAGYRGEFVASAEIAELGWFGYGDRARLAPVDQLIADDLHAAGRLH